MFSALEYFGHLGDQAQKGSAGPAGGGNSPLLLHAGGSNFLLLRNGTDQLLLGHQ